MAKTWLSERIGDELLCFEVFATGKAKLFGMLIKVDQTEATRVSEYG